MSPSWTKAHDSRKKLHMKPMQLSVCKQHAFPEILSLLSSKISPSHTPRSTLGCRACSGASTNVMLFLKVPPTMVLNEKSFMCHSTTTPGASSQNNTMHGSHGSHGSYRFSAQCALFFLCSGALHVVVSSCCLFFCLIVHPGLLLLFAFLSEIFLSLFLFWIHWYRLVVLDWPSKKGLVLQIYISTNLT